MKILISAYACSPYQGSEASMGWGFVHELSKYHDLTVFVEAEKFRNDIERWLIDNSNYSKINFIFVKKRRNRWLRKIWPPSYYKYYKEWHLNVFNIARELLLHESYDLAHQLTMSGFREPGYLWRLDVPLVWGPIGAMGYFPAKFLSHVGLKGFFYHAAYNFYNYIHMNFLARPQKAARKAGYGLISATSETQRFIKDLWSLESTIINEIGIPNLEENISVKGRNLNEPIRLIWSGLHISRKALNLAIYSVSQLPQNLDWELHILGGGELTEKWKEYADHLNVSDRCKFHGMITRSDALDVMMSGHISLITSLRDLTSAVTIESLTLGLPVICLDHCGFSDVIDDSCGIAVTVTNFGEVTSGISEAINLLASDESYRQDLSKGALEKSEAFSWGNKVDKLNEIYIETLNDYDANN